MTHALILPALAADGDRVPFHADPVLAAIERRSEAWAVFQAAPSGEPALRAEDEADAALMALLGTACATRAGMFCLVRHLRWFLAEEASNAEGHGDAWTVAQAREADLSRCLGVERIERLLLAPPSGRLVGPVLDLAPVPAPIARPCPDRPALPRRRADPCPVWTCPRPSRRGGSRPGRRRRRDRLHRIRHPFLTCPAGKPRVRQAGFPARLQTGSPVMRNPFKRQPRADGKPTLRERLAATREDLGTALRIHRALKASPSKPAPPVDRAALVNYATWLYVERRLVCAELYPHLGARSTSFVLEASGADQFHFPPGKSIDLKGQSTLDPHEAAGLDCREGHEAVGRVVPIDSLGRIRSRRRRCGLRLAHQPGGGRLQCRGTLLEGGAVGIAAK